MARYRPKDFTLTEYNIRHTLPNFLASIRQKIMRILRAQKSVQPDILDLFPDLPNQPANDSTYCFNIVARWARYAVASSQSNIYKHRNFAHVHTRIDIVDCQYALSPQKCCTTYSRQHSTRKSAVHEIPCSLSMM